MFRPFICACFLLVSSVFCSTPAFAGKVELTTYYPAPWGEYKNLKTTEDAYFATTSGYVGIGTETPELMLDITRAMSYGTDDAFEGQAGKLKVGTTEIASFESYYFSIDQNIKWTGSDKSYRADGSATRLMMGGWPGALTGLDESDFAFFTAPHTGAKDAVMTMTEVMRIKESGSVGIGTTAPLGTLDTRGSATVGTWLGLFAQNGITPENSAVAPTYQNKMLSVQGNGAAYIMGRDITNDIEFVMGTSSNGGAFAGSMTAHDFWLRTNNVNRMTILKTTGYVGIGTTAPTHLIHLNGGAYCDGTGAWIAGSDKAYKRDVDYNFKYGLKEVEQLKPVYYVHKEDKENKKQIGFIAQDVRKVVPELVSGEEGALGLSYGQLTAVLVKAVQEQQAEIDLLKKEVAELRKQKTTV